MRIKDHCIVQYKAHPLTLTGYKSIDFLGVDAALLLLLLLLTSMGRGLSGRGLVLVGKLPLFLALIVCNVGTALEEVYKCGVGVLFTCGE